MEPEGSQEFATYPYLSQINPVHALLTDFFKIQWERLKNPRKLSHSLLGLWDEIRNQDTPHMKV
jgi:hypothetical protein